MTLGTNFVRSFNPIWYFVDLVGRQLDDTFWLYTLTNTIPYIPQAVFSDVNGTIPYPDPIQFLPNGTLPVDIYWDDTEVYRLEIRQNDGVTPPSQADALIYLIENYIPGSSLNIPGATTPSQTDNQISNGQFAIMSVASPFTLTGVTNPSPIEVAPGWFLTLTGTGTVTITKVSLNTTLPSPTNAPYALQIQLTGGWTGSPTLSQRFYQNGQNWQNKYLSTSITAFASGMPAQLLIRLVASTGQPLALLDNPLVGNVFTEYTGVALIPVFANLNIPPAAYIDYQISLPAVTDIYLTSIQLVASDVNQVVDYEQTTVNRQIDQLFHYYNPKLQYKQIPSWLIGWDFPLNPAQILGPTVPIQALGVNTGFYAWDQTIVYQTITNGVSISRAANGGLMLTSNGAGQIALIQYLDQATARSILSDRVSVRINASTTAAAGTLAGNVTLWATTDANAPTLPATLISTIGANGIPATAPGAWVQVPNILQNTAFTLNPASATNSESTDIMLNGWDEQGAAICNTATYFSIVVGFIEWANLDTVTFNSISLCSGDIATRPSPKSADETHRDCERYYEKSYQASQYVGIVTPGVGPITTFNELQAPIVGTVPTGGNGNAFPMSTTLEFRSIKRIPATQGFPTVQVYSPITGTAGNVSCFSSGQANITADKNFATFYTSFIGNKFATFQMNPALIVGPQLVSNATTPIVGYINYHYTADARIGIVN